MTSDLEYLMSLKKVRSEGPHLGIVSANFDRVLDIAIEGCKDRGDGLPDGKKTAMRDAMITAEDLQKAAWEMEEVRAASAINVEEQYRIKGEAVEAANKFKDLENISVSTNAAIWNAIREAYELGTRRVRR